MINGASEWTELWEEGSEGEAEVAARIRRIVETERGVAKDPRPRL